MAEKTKPTITVPDKDPPRRMQIDDIEVGDGAEALPGTAPLMHYVGVSWSTGKEFDASWDRGSAFSFQLGKNQVIAGWEQGVAGMKVGGRRQLIIPPHLAYGAQGAGGGVIAPNETLIFVVDLMDVRNSF